MKNKVTCSKVCHYKHLRRSSTQLLISDTLLRFSVIALVDTALSLAAVGACDTLIVFSLVNRGKNHVLRKIHIIMPRRIYTKFLVIVLLVGSSYCWSQSPLPEIARVHFEQVLQSAEDMKKKNPDESTLRANQVLASAVKLDDQEYEAKALIILARVAKVAKDFTMAQGYLDRALNIGQKIGNDEIIINSLYNISDIQRFVKEFKAARATIGDGLEIAKKIAHHELVYRGFNIQGNIYKSEKSYDEALLAYQTSLEYAETHKLQTYIVRAHRNIAKIYSSLKDTEASLVHNLQALEVTESSPNAESDEIAKHLEAIVDDQRKLGQFAPALQNAQRALNVYRSLNDAAGIEKSLLNLAIIYRRLGIYDSALEYASELLRTYEEKDDSNGIASAANQIATIYSHFEQYDDAERFYKKTLAMPEQAIEKKYHAAALRGVASILHKRLQGEEALEYANNAKALYKTLKSIEGLESTNRLIGQIHNDLGNSEASVKAFEEALAQSKKSGSRWPEASNLIHMGSVLVEQDPKRAREIISEGIRIAKRQKTKSLIIDGYQALALLEQKAGDYEKAYDLLKKQYNLTRDLNKQEVKKRIADLKIIREINEKERKIEVLERKSKIDALELDRQSAELKIITKENTISRLRLERERIFRILLIFLTILILLVLAELYGRFRYSRSMQWKLHQKNTQIEAKNRTLEDSNATKDRFLSIVAHDLRGPISALTALTGLLKDQLENFSRDQLQEHANSLHDASEQTLILVNDLLEWAMTQVRNTDPIPRSHSILTICSKSIESVDATAKAKKINIKCSIDESLNVFADQNMVKAVVRNILSNAIKFTPQNGEVIIYAEDQGDAIVTHIKDSGMGIDPEKIPHLFDIEKKISELGTEGEKGSGFGLTLCKEFVEKNGGEIKVSSELDKGTDFVFTLPSPSR